MDRFSRGLAAAAAALLVAAAPMAAQAPAAGDGPVQRGSLTFVGTELLIQVDADVGGELRVVRGGVGRVQVVGRAPGGMVAFGLENGGTARLNLAALGGESVSYLVVVPGRTRVRVRLPDDPLSHGIHSRLPSATLTWDAPASRRGR